MRILLLNMFLVSYVLFPGRLTYAQDSSADDKPESILVIGKREGSDGLDLKKTSQTGSRLGIPLRETPASVEIIDQNKMLERGQGTLLEAVENAAGMSGGNPPGAPTIFSTRGFSGDSVSILYNGVRIANPGMSTSPGDTWNLEQIEILKGPASVLHGYGAVGGAVNYISKRAKPSPQQFEGLLTVGSWNKVRLGLGTGGPLSDDFYYRMDVSQQTADTFVDNAPYRYQAASASFLYNWSDSWSFGLDIEVTHNDISSYFGTPLVNRDLDKRFFFKNYNVKDDKTLIDANWLRFYADWKASSDLTFKNMVYRYKANRHWKNVEYYSYDPAQDQVLASDLIEIKHDQTLIGNQLTMTLKQRPFGLDNSFLVGIDVSQNTFTHTNNSGYGGSFSFDPDTPQAMTFDDSRQQLTLPKRQTVDQHTALFVEDRLIFNPAFQLVLGARSDTTQLRSKRLNLDTDLQGQTLGTLEPSFTKNLQGTTGRIGVVSEVSSNTFLFAQHTTAESSPVSLVNLAKRSEDFKMEKSRQFELGIKQALNLGLDYTFSLYQISRQNLFTRDPKDPSRTEQIGQQSSQGAELALSWRPLRTLTWEGNISLLKAKFDTFYSQENNVPISYRGKKPSNVPEKVFNSSLDYHWKQLAILFGVRYISERQADFSNSFSYPAYTLVHSALTYKFESSEISLLGKNLTDKRYIQWGDGGDMALLGQPLSWEISLHTSL